MKTKHIISAVALVGLFSAFSTQQQIAIGQTTEKTEFRKIESEAYKPGEVLEYRLHNGVINAGTARLEVNKLDKKIAGREVYHVVGTGKSKGAFDWFFKVRDRYETYIDKKTLLPLKFIRHVREGGYKYDNEVIFKHYKNEAVGTYKTVEIPKGVQDVLSAIYKTRSINFSKYSNNTVSTIGIYSRVVTFKHIYKRDVINIKCT